jgi:hypothetical protein
MAMFRPAHWRALLALAFATTCLGAAAHSEGEHDDAGDLGFYDCDHPPANAVRTVPAPLSQWARFECNGAGQRLVAAQHWQWRFPASWTTRPDLPAWTPAASFVLPGPKHFVKLEVFELDAAELDAAHERLLRDSLTYRFHVETRPRAMFRLAALNSLGHDMDVFFPVVSDDRLWAVPCVPDCRPEFAFIIERAPR